MDSLVDKYDGKNGVIIQARMGSKRLPGKTLLKFDKKNTTIDLIIKRLNSSKFTDIIIFSIPDTSDNDVLAEKLDLLNLHYYRGHPDDLVSRFYNTCKKFDLNQFVRVTGDNPLVDYEIVDFFLQIDKKIQFVDGFTPKVLPNGTVISRLSFSLIEMLNKKETNKFHREHIVTSPILDRHRFLPNFPKKWHGFYERYCLDDYSDYLHLKNIIQNHNAINLKTSELIKIHKTIKKINYENSKRGY